MPKATLARSPSDRLLRPLLQDCRHLLSERGEANGPGIAAGIVQQIDALADPINRRRQADPGQAGGCPGPRAGLSMPADKLSDGHQGWGTSGAA